MNLYTRCSGCQTVFRVTTRELQASNGRVRCGQCQKVFDAFASLTAQEPEEENAPPVAARPRQTPSVASGALEPSAPQRAAVPPEGASQPARLTRPDPAASLYEWEFRMPPQGSRSSLWVMLSTALMVTATVQAAAAFRDEIVVAFPAAQPLYDSACERIGCRIGLPRPVDRLHVEASDLHLLSSARPNQIELTVLLRNRAPVAVEYPAFELTLTSEQDEVLARRIFLPAEYLDAAASMHGGLSGGGELPIRLFLDTGNIAATGYRLYFFYP